MNHHTLITRILQARVYEVAIESDLDPARKLSQRLNNHVFIKREDQQPIFSFKCRGAYNRMAQLTPEELSRGVIAASAGNHAQGVALAAKTLGVRGTIVMPQTTPDIKVMAVKALGGHVVLHGDSYDDAFAHAQSLIAEKNYVFIHPYDDLDVIAGQGTVAAEILRQHRGPLDAVYIPVGGGGLLAGMSAYLKHVSPHTRVVAVEPEDSACFAAAFQAGSRVVLDQVGLFADGVAVRQIGQHTFDVAKDCVDEVITVTTDEICAAIKDLFDEYRCIAEPSGALALAGLKKHAQQQGLSQQHLVAIHSGANMNFDRLRFIAERTELGEQREAVFAVTIPEKAGAFKAFCQAMGKRSITEFNYRYAGPGQAHVFVGVSLRGGHSERMQLIGQLSDRGYQVTDLSDDEMAKSHVRHLVGGHAGLSDERLLRFEFPERPGALMNFLTRLGSGWNISLFHYRNHGAAEGRVLVGLQLGRHTQEALTTQLANVGYPFIDETDNPAYQLFLR